MTSRSTIPNDLRDDVSLLSLAGTACNAMVAKRSILKKLSELGSDTYVKVSREPLESRFFVQEKGSLLCKEPRNGARIPVSLRDTANPGSC